MKKITLRLSGFFLICSSLSSNSVNITGQITDQNGFPVSFAVVEHTQSEKWSVSDENGFFHLWGDFKNNDILLISRIGYEPENFSLEGRTSVKILLNKHVFCVYQLLHQKLGL